MVKLPRVTLEGSKVEKNSKQSVVTLALPVELSWREGRRDQGNTTLPPASVSFLLQCLWNSCWWGDYATTCASVSVASYSRSQCLCSHINEKLSVSAESSRHGRWPSVQLNSTVQVEQRCVLSNSKRMGTERGGGGGVLTRHRGLMVVKVQQTLWSQQGGSVYVLWPANFVSACSSFRLIISSANGRMWDESITHGSKPAGGTTPGSYKTPLWRLFGCTFGKWWIFLFMKQTGGFRLRLQCCFPRKHKKKQILNYKILSICLF